MVFKNGVKDIQAAAYNGAHTVTLNYKSGRFEIMGGGGGTVIEGHKQDFFV